MGELPELPDSLPEFRGSPSRREVGKRERGKVKKKKGKGKEGKEKGGGERGGRKFAPLRLI